MCKYFFIKCYFLIYPSLFSVAYESQTAMHMLSSVASQPSSAQLAETLLLPEEQLQPTNSSAINSVPSEPIEMPTLVPSSIAPLPDPDPSIVPLPAPSSYVQPPLRLSISTSPEGSFSLFLSYLLP